MADAGALGLAGTAALTAIEAVSPAEGEDILVVGATGGVGARRCQVGCVNTPMEVSTDDGCCGYQNVGRRRRLDWGLTGR